MAMRAKSIPFNRKSPFENIISRTFLQLHLYVLFEIYYAVFAI